MEFTHNLKIVLFDKKNNVVENEVFLEEIKEIFCKMNTYDIERNGKIENILIQWNKKKLNKIEKHFMGDLFSYPIYEFDSIILQHTNIIINNINSDYIIKFYIFRLPMNKIILKDMIGFV